MEFREVLADFLADFNFKVDRGGIDGHRRRGGLTGGQADGVRTHDCRNLGRHCLSFGYSKYGVSVAPFACELALRSETHFRVDNKGVLPLHFA